MRKLILVVAPALLLFIAGTAHADTLGIQSDPSGIYGPYEMSLNGGAATPMICYSATNDIYFGETWNVEALTIGSAVGGEMAGGTAFAGTTAQYDELGYLANELFADPGNADLQDAIWSVLGTDSATLSSQEIADLSAASAAVAGGYVTADTFYIPTSWSQGYGEPQPFIAPDPVAEPGTLALLAIGLMGLGLLVRKRGLATS
jgi:hypothetical protein